MKSKKLHDLRGRKQALPSVSVGRAPVARATAAAESAGPKHPSRFEMAFLAERGCLSEKSYFRKIA
jgi:hypothetical protein